MASNRWGRADEALGMANGLALPLLRAARRFDPAARILVHHTSDRRIHLVLVEMPAGHPLLVALYSSTQRSRPASPAQVERRLRRLETEVKKLRGRIYSQADVVMLYISAARLTRRAYRLARSLGVYVALSVEQARLLLARHLYRRVHGLRRARKLFGPLLRLAELLAYLARQLADDSGDAETLLQAYHLSPEEGGGMKHPGASDEPGRG